MAVVKRDGRVEEFSKGKVKHAIEKAMRTTPEGVDHALCWSVANYVMQQNFLQEQSGISLTVDQIHSMIEDRLMDSNRKDAAKAYIQYRAERDRVRRVNGELYQRTQAFLSGDNITNENANVDQYSFSGMENRVGAELHKRYASDNLLTERVRKAFENGYIHIHDFDKYAVGMHNCLVVDLAKLLRHGFKTRNGDVRGARSVNTAFQLVAVIFQCQSQTQFGGVACAHIDSDIAPFVRMSFARHYKEGLYHFDGFSASDADSIVEHESIRVDDDQWLKLSPDAWYYAYDMLEREGLQAAQAMYHNLNTLESRAGSQVPFTSINFGRDTSREGQLVSEWILKASLDGIGKHHRTSIFPISIFQYKKGVNDRPGTPNYYLKELAMESMAKRIYPNWVNCDYSGHEEDEGDIDTIITRMGCRTAIGRDRHGLGYTQVGRGNAAPVTVILPKLGIEYGICLKRRSLADLEGFWNALDSVLVTARESLLDRFTHMSSRSPKAAPFMYENGTIQDADKCGGNTFPALRHCTLAIGFIGLAELCEALFGNSFVGNIAVRDFAMRVVKYIHSFCAASSEQFNLNFSCYATPAEGLCETAANQLRATYGSIPNVCDRKYLTNSCHVPVWESITIHEKLKLEQPFTQYATGGSITYIEVDSQLGKNLAAVEKIIDTAMSMDIPYLAINFPIDTCLECGYQGEVGAMCPMCGSRQVEHLARVTGYLSTDVSRFNRGKQAEVSDRVKHTRYVDLGDGSKL